MWAQHNSWVSLRVIPISKGCFWQISNITIKFVFMVFLYLNPSSVHVVLNWYWARTLIKVTEGIKLVHQIDLVCDFVILFIAHHKSVSFKLTIYRVFFYTLKPVCRTIFETLWKTSKFTCNEVDNWRNFTVSVRIRKSYICLFLCHKYGLWNQLNQQIFVILVIGLPLQLKWIPKKSSWKIMFSRRMEPKNKIPSTW